MLGRPPSLGRMEVVAHVREARLARGLTQRELARRAGLTRQALGAIETGRYLPNTALALKLARLLGETVEALFREASSPGELEVAVEEAAEGERVLVARVRDRWVGVPLETSALEPVLEGADAIALGEDRVRLVTDERELESSALLLGCDPALGILASRATRSGARTLFRQMGSRAALDRLAAGAAHVAGSHLAARDNVRAAKRALSDHGGRVVAFARFEHGLLVAPGNPKGIEAIDALAREDVRIANREAGSGSRVALDAELARAGVPTNEIRGYAEELRSHWQVARAVQWGRADTGIGPRVVASSAGLDFVPLGSVRFDLAVPGDLLDQPAVARMLELLADRRVRDEIASLPGYDTSCTGDTIAEVPG